MLGRETLPGRSGFSTWSRHAATACMVVAAVGGLNVSAEEKKPADLYGDPLPAGAVGRLGTTRFRHPATVSYVAFTPDGKGLVSAGQDSTIRLWDVKTGQEIRRFGGPSPTPAAAGDLQDAVLRLQQVRAGYGVGGGGTVVLAPDGRTLAVSGPGSPIQLWEVATGKPLRQIKAPGNALGGLLFSADSKTLVARGADQTIYFWETDTGKTIRELKAPPPNPQNARFGMPLYFGSLNMAFSPDGKTLALPETVFENQKPTSVVRLLDAQTGNEVRRITAQAVGMSALAYSPDGKVLAYASGTTLTLADAATGQEIRRIDGQQPGLASLVFAPDGKTLATKGLRDGLIRLWDAGSGKMLREVGDGAKPLAQGGGFAAPAVSTGRDLAFSPDGKVIASGGSSAVRLWEAANGNEVAAVNGHRAAVTNLVITPDGNSVASKGADNTIRRWDAASGKQGVQFATPPGTTCVAFTADGKTAALGNQDSSVRLLEVATGKELHKLTGHQNAVAVVAFSADGKTLASRGSLDNTIRLWDPASGKEIRQFPVLAQGNPGAGGQVMMVRGTMPNPVGLAFSPDGTQLASPVGGLGMVPGQWGAGGALNALQLWDVRTGKAVRRIELPAQPGVRGFAFAPDGRTLATENTDQTVTLWEVASGKERARLGTPVSPAPGQGQNGTVMVVGGFNAFGGMPAASPAIAFTADGRTLVARGADTSVRVWDVAACKEIGVLKGHEGGVTALAVAADGKTVASGSSDTTILLWDLTRLSRPRDQSAELQAGDVESFWGDLGREDAVKAYQAVRKLVKAPGQAVPFLAGRLRPAERVEASKIEQLVADLDSAKFSARQQATRELEKLGDLAVPALTKASAGQTSLEAQRRVEQILEKLTGRALSDEQLRLVRALEILELIGTTEARQVLDGLTQGAPGALATRQARAALDRLAARSAAQN